jgi:hypothetical protein
MNLIIRIKDGKPFEHPIVLSNFVEAFPNVDLDNLPPEFAWFERILPPAPGVYEVYDGVTYEWDNSIVKDVHHVRPMTDEEITETQNLVKAQWAEFGHPSWIFNEETCTFDAPVPYPSDGQKYTWNEEAQSWDLIPVGNAD